MYTIYKVTNKINGKAYVGFDSNWPSRKSVHLCESLTRKNKKYPLYRAIAKYGKENFDWDIIFQSEERDYTLNVMENKCIKEHNTHFRDGHGYNMTYGGEGAFGWKPTEENKTNISNSLKGRKAWNKGIKAPWATERNKKLKGCKQPKLCKTYLVTDPMGNKQEITGLVDFCKEHNLDPSGMSAVAYGKQKTHKGWSCHPINIEKEQGVKYICP